MAAPAPAIPPFKKDKKFLDGSVDASIEVSAPLAPEIAKALATNGVFPPGTIKLGTISAGISGGTDDLPFGGATGGVVSFSGSAHAGGGLGVYSSSIEMLKDVAGEDSVVDDDEIMFPDAGTARYLAMSWSYDVNGAASGSVALGQLGIKFGVEGNSAGRFLTILRFGDDPGAQEAVQKLLGAWALPRQINDISDIDPGTWIVAEVNGGLKAHIGAEVGFDYNWIRSVKLQGLSGDIGLRIQAAAELTVGFELAGKYAVMVCRESLDPNEKKVRVRLKKLAKKGWSFALHANVGVDVSTGKFLPESMDDFVAGIVGVHGAQVVEDLKEVRRWTDPKTPLNTLAGDFVVDLAKKEFALAFGIDPKDAFEKAHKRVMEFLDAWADPQLGHKASTLLLSVVRGQAGLATLETALRDFAKADDATLKKLIRDELAKAEALPGPVRSFLESVTSAGALAALDRIPEIGRIRTAASKAIDILDGKVIEHLQTFLEEKLNLKALDNLTFDQVDKRLKEKLGAFLGKTLDLQAFDGVRQTIHSLLDKADDLYKAACEAVNKKYEFDLLFSYQSLTTRTALVDVTFDFGQNSQLGTALSSVIDGDFSTHKLFTQPPSGVHLNEGLLTHGINRQSSLDLTLPHFSSSTGSITDSLASLKVSAEGSCILLDSSNETFRKGQWASRLALTMDIPSAARTGIRMFADQQDLAQAMSTTYKFELARKQLGAVQLQQQLQPIIEKYFPGVFGGGKGTLDQWVMDFDKHADATENNGTGLIGNTLLSLEVSLPGRALASWWNAPKSDKDPLYREMSKNIQRVLRLLLPYSYFQEMEHYSGQSFAACAVMLYSSLPVASSVRLRDGSIVFDTERSFYWDFLDERPDGDLPLMIGNSLTDANLREEMRKAQTILDNSDSLHGQAQFYVPSEFGDVKSAGATGQGRHLLKHSLLFTEIEVISGAVDAGKKIASFRAAKDDEQALAELDRFGAKIVETFNKRLTNLFDSKTSPELLRNFGLLVFLEASRALHPTLGAVPVTARLDLKVMKAAAAFPPAGFPLSHRLKLEDIVIAQPILNV